MVEAALAERRAREQAVDEILGVARKQLATDRRLAEQQRRKLAEQQRLENELAEELQRSNTENTEQPGADGHSSGWTQQMDEATDGRFGENTENQKAGNERAAETRRSGRQQQATAAAAAAARKAAKKRAVTVTAGLVTIRRSRVPRKKRRQYTRWTEDEVRVLKEGVRVFGRGKWLQILDWGMEFNNRSAVDLKDKWRTLNR
eukprot:COSAG01_NODE_5316_length_4320_cov_7.936792_3_plen_203_part_00